MTKTTPKTTWPEKDLKKLYDNYVACEMALDPYLACATDYVYDHFDNDPGTFHHDAEMPSVDKLTKMIEKWLLADFKREVQRIAKESAVYILEGLENYAKDNTPENPEAKMERLANEYKAVQANFLAKLSPEEQKQLTQLNP